MAIKIVWSYFAKEELKNIFNFYKINASLKIANNLVVEIVKKTNSLSSHAKIGQKEDLLLERSEGFRYLVYKNYKVIYFFNKEKNRIEISDVFDTRQNPVKIKRQK